MRYTLYLFLPFLCGLSQAQTKIDLRSQSKEVDFSTANATRPLKVGPVLPPTCMIGEIFFHSTAAPGSNIYGCVAADTWIRQGTGSGTGSGSGTIETKIDGVPVGSRAIMNMVSGQGMVNILSDDGIQINVQHAIDSSFVETRPLLQSGTTLLCTSLDGAPSNYTCSMTPSLREYVPGMVIHWRPDVDGAGGLTTLNIDNAGTQIIKLIDGRDPSPADIIAGYQYDLWFDGTTFRMKAPLGMAISAAIPPCTIAERARLWLTPGSIGVKDTVSICAKDASDTYAWRPLY